MGEALLMSNNLRHKHKSFNAPANLTVAQFLVALSLLANSAASSAQAYSWGFSNTFQEERVTANNLGEIARELQELRALCGSYPKTEQGIDALIPGNVQKNLCGNKSYHGPMFQEVPPGSRIAWPDKFTSDGTSFRIEGRNGYFVSSQDTTVRNARGKPWKTDLPPVGLNSWVGFYALCIGLLSGLISIALRIRKKSFRAIRNATTIAWLSLLAGCLDQVKIFHN
jgi:hypothetical protein